MRVLVLEDDPILRSVWADTLGDEGFEVHEAAEAAEAIALIARQRFEVLVLDLMLDEGTSESVSSYAKVVAPHAFVVLVTGSGLFPNGEHRHEMPGVDWLLRKPVAIADLAAVVAHAGSARRPAASA